MQRRKNYPVEARGTARYPHGMSDEQDDAPGGLIAAVMARSGVIIGAVGLVGWLALLWFMFGDVL